jgi:hypothetical protein
MHGREINVYKVLVGNLKERDHFEDLGVGWGILLKRTLKKYDAMARGVFMWLKIGIGDILLWTLQCDCVVSYKRGIF